MPSAHGPCFVVRSCEKKPKRGSAFSRIEVSEHGPIICCNQLRENIGAILYRSESQRTRTDFQSVATFMIVLIMKLMPQAKTMRYS